MTDKNIPMDPKLKRHLEYLERRHQEIETHFRALGLADDPTTKTLLAEGRERLEHRREIYSEMSNEEGRGVRAEDRRSAARWRPDAKTPEVRADFDQARTGRRRQESPAKKAKRALEMKPPSPNGMGQGQASPVSPYLREEKNELPPI